MHGNGLKFCQIFKVILMMHITFSSCMVIIIYFVSIDRKMRVLKFTHMLTREHTHTAA